MNISIISLLVYFRLSKHTVISQVFAYYFSYLINFYF